MVILDQDEFARRRRRLVDELSREGIIRTEQVKRGFNSVPREEFVWQNMRSNAYTDTPLPLGDTGQTISAPHMVAIMLEELELKPGLKVLEVGSGSGYSAALTAEIVASQGGSVVAVERLAEMADFSGRNIERTGYSNAVSVHVGDGSLGYPPRCEDELYDRIVVTAGATKLPPYLKKQLRVDGILLVPVGDIWSQTLVKVRKLKDGKFVTQRLCECIFVPLIESTES